MPLLSEKFFGKWKVVDADTENFEKYLAKVGIPWIIRKFAKNMNADIEYLPDKLPLYHVKVTSIMRNLDATFKLDGTFEDEKTLDGRNCKSKNTISEDGKTIDQKQTWDAGKRIS